MDPNTHFRTCSIYQPGWCLLQYRKLWQGFVKNSLRCFFGLADNAKKFQVIRLAQVEEMLLKNRFLSITFFFDAISVFEMIFFVAVAS